MLKNPFFYSLTILVISCNLSKLHGQDQGVIILHRYLIEPDTTMSISAKILYLKNHSIQEIVQLNTIDSLGKKAFFTKVLKYAYLDPDKNICYNYRNFSDTAKAINYYTNIDSAGYDAGWNFYSSKKLDYDSLIKLKDTSIDNIIYTRIRIDRKLKDGGIYSSIYFFRCNKKGTLIKFVKPLSDSIGCPVVRIDSYLRNKLVMINELEFLSDTLSQEERKTFDVWDKNAEVNLFNKKE